MAPVKASATATMATVINNIIGGGLLALPFTFKRASLYPGIAAMCVTGTLNCITMVLIGTACEISGARNYKELGQICFGTRANMLISLVMALYTFGSCISYIVLIGDNLPQVLLRGVDPNTVADSNPTLAFFANRATMAVASAILVLFPLSSQRNLSALRYTARVAFLCIVYVVCMLVSKCIQGPRAPPEDIVYVDKGTGIFVGFPITMVAFCMHYNTPRFYFELEGHNPWRFGWIATACFGFTLVVYQATAVSGYLLFGTSTKGDILENFGNDDNLAFAARVALSIVMLFSYPLAFNSYRASFVALSPLWVQERMVAGPALAQGYIAQQEKEQGELSAMYKLWVRVSCDWPHYLITAVLVSLSVGVAIAIPQIELVLGYKGALGGTIIVYILPGLMFFTMLRRMRAQGLTLSDIAGLKRVAGEKDLVTGEYNAAKLVTIGAVQRTLEPEEVAAAATAAASGVHTPEKGSGSGGGKAHGSRVKGAPATTYTPLSWASATPANEPSRPLLDEETEAESEDAVAQFLSVPVRTLRSGSKDTGGEGRGGIEGVAALAALNTVEGPGGGFNGTWAGDLLTSGYGWLAVFLTVWGLMVMVLGTLTTAGALGSS